MTLHDGGLPAETLECRYCSVVVCIGRLAIGVREASVMLMKAERQQLIVERVKASGRVVVTDLADELGVTRDTIRKDLQELSKKGAVQRVHGGAVGVDQELTRFESRIDIDHDEKVRLAKAAMGQITSHRVIFIDGGSTNYIAAQCLPASFNGTVVTNNPAVALLLSDHDKVEVDILPGLIHHKSKETVGSPALAAIQRLHCDLVLLGVSSIDPEYGVTAPYLESAETKRALVRSGGTVMALVTKEKFGRVSTYHVADCNQIDIMVTTQPEERLTAYTGKGMTIQTV